jgi:hypothetical protein
VWGFQLTAVDSLGVSFGDLIVMDSARTMITTGLSGRQYLSHTDTGSVGDNFNGAAWAFGWVAPPSTSAGQRLHLYASGLIADGDGTVQGDAVVTSVFLEHPYYCPVRVPGDANCSGQISSADIILLVSYIFRGGSQPCPCSASGDVNCDGAVTSADVITLVNYIFKSGSVPCDPCPLVLEGTWDC